MNRYLALALFVTLCICGCDGSAELTIVNETPGYVNGVVQGDETFRYHVNRGTSKTFTVAVGEGMLDNTRVIITANIHEGNSPDTRVVATDKETIHMEEDHEYRYVVPYDNPYRLELRSVRSKRSITGP